LIFGAGGRGKSDTAIAVGDDSESLAFLSPRYRYTTSTVTIFLPRWSTLLMVKVTGSLRIRMTPVEPWPVGPGMYSESDGAVITAVCASPVDVSGAMLSYGGFGAVGWKSQRSEV